MDLYSPVSFSSNGDVDVLDHECLSIGCDACCLITNEVIQIPR